MLRSIKKIRSDDFTFYFYKVVDLNEVPFVSKKILENQNQIYYMLLLYLAVLRLV